MDLDKEDETVVDPIMEEEHSIPATANYSGNTIRKRQRLLAHEGDNDIPMSNVHEDDPQLLITSPEDLVREEGHRKWSLTEHQSTQLIKTITAVLKVFNYSIE